MRDFYFGGVYPGVTVGAHLGSWCVVKSLLDLYICVYICFYQKKASVLIVLFIYVWVDYVGSFLFVDSLM